MRKLTFILYGFLCSTALFAKEQMSSKNIEASKNARLQFIENKGQITDQDKKARNDIDFKLEVKGLTIFGGDAQLHYQWSQTDSKPEDSILFTNIYRMDVKLLGANTSAVLQKEEPQNYYENYYGVKYKGVATAKSYSRLVYKNIYPQIDWVIYTNGQALKYDFVVHKGGNPADIRLQYDGAVSAKLKDGAFTATTPMGSITEEAPYSYEATTKMPVASAFRLKDNVLSFDVEKQNAAIVIDPNLVWATYYGGLGQEWGSDIVADDSNKVYFTGYTNSTSNIATTGSYKSTITGTWDRFVASLNESCVRQWATYIGVGNNYTSYNNGGIAIDTQNKFLYIAGHTADTVNVATTGAHQTTLGGGVDAYLMKFSYSGFRIWGTYYGGSGNEYYNVGVETDHFGNVYLTGQTQSATNIATTGAYISTIPLFNSNPHGQFLAKFNGSGVRQWATYLCLNTNGSGWQNNGNLATDINGNVYVTGQAYNSCAVGTAGTHSQFPIGISVNNNDVWLAKFTPSGGLAWATFYGGQGQDYVSAIAAADNGDVYIGGWTVSDTGIANSAGFRTTRYNSNWHDGYLVRFNNQGRRVWGTYVGDSTTYNTGYNNGITNIEVYQNNRIVVSGSTINNILTQPHDLVTSNAFQPVRNSIVDAYVGIVDTACNRVWGSFFGGDHHEGYGGSGYGNGGLTLTKKYIYLCGSTFSSNLLAYGTGIYQNFYAGSWDTYVTKISLDTFVEIRQPFIDTVFCTGDTFKVKTSVNHPFRSANVFSVQLSNASGSFASPTVIGTKTANGNDSITCVIPLTTTAGNGYRIRIVASAPADTSDNNGLNIRIKSIPSSVLASSNSPVCVDDTIKLYGSSTHTDVTYSWTGVGGFASGAKDTIRANVVSAFAGNYILTASRQGCVVKDTVTIQVRQRPSDTAIASSNSPVCTNGTINLNGTSTTIGVSYLWKGPGGYTSNIQSPSRVNAVTSYSGIYKLYTALNGCPSTYYDSIYVTVYPPTPAPAPSSNSPVCTGQDLQLTAGTVPGATYVWTGPGGYSATTQNPLRPASLTSYAGKYYVQAVLNGCISAPDSMMVTVNAGPTISMYPSPKDSICVGGSVMFVSNATNTGTGYVRNWYKNNTVIGGAANANYTATAVSDGDEFYTTITVYGVCATPFTAKGNVIKMRVLPYLAPSVSISANPNTTVTSGTMINFTATPTNGGNTPKYQWTRNGTNITGAISNIWGASTLSNNDQICVDMTSGYLCPNPKTAKSNCIKVSIESTGIVGVWTGKEPSIYPNPTNDKLTIEGIDKGTKIQLSDVLGRVVIKATATSETTELTMSHLAAGSYMLTLSKDNGDRMSVKVVKE
jgi:hypothetical protein